MEFKILFKGLTYSINSKLLGKHNVENILAAILVADHLNINISKIIKSIKLLKPIKNRLEFKLINDQLAIINDAFNSNPEGIYEAMNILDSIKGYKKILITPGLIDLGDYMQEFHQKFGYDLTTKVDELFIVGNLNKDDILKGIKNTSFTNYHEHENFIDCYNQAINIKGKKVILIANDLPEKFNE
jgi:UDP-N-acetylmuramoyl-tripeptide--D-alanyl-D-alanine ligase